jgi:alanine racemase
MNPAAYAVIDVNAARHNLQKVRELAPKAKIMAIIKANAYGHGFNRIAQGLTRVDAFAVARVAEGIYLRKAGITKPITVLEGFTCTEELAALLNFQLEPVVHTINQLEILECKQTPEKLAIWLKLDTGMNRLGFKAHEFNAVYQRLCQCAIIKQPINLMTHLANADDRNDDFTQRQISLFNETVPGIGQRSIANSAGIIAWQQALTDWVRPGIMLYGISPFSETTGEQLGLKAVMGLHSRLIAVKPVQKGDRVGYGGSWICEQNTLLGVVAIGYGDGFPRYARAGTPVLVNNMRVPLIGRVSMDMITVDLQNQPNAKPGDPVCLWGKGLAVEEIAGYANTIPYTLVCGVTSRVRQIEDSNE